jgi:protein-tyrosine phosphatase
MPQVVDWRNAANQQEVVDQAARALREGRLVAFPTEAVYELAAHAPVPDAVARLQQRGRAVAEEPTLALRDVADLRAWVPDAGPLAERLARRCWPGAVALAFPADRVRGGLPEPVWPGLRAGGVVRFRVPAHPAVLGALQRLDGPLVLAGLEADGRPAATAEGAARAAGDAADLVLDDGLCPLGRPATVVGVDGDRWAVLREGAVAADVVAQLAARLIVFVCTGNTCRSPLAEVLCKQLLAERLGCPPGELPRRGYFVTSAGLVAFPGGPAADEAVEVAREHGLDLSGHRSRLLTDELLAQADHLVTMTAGHRHVLAEQYADLGPRPRLLSPEGDDIADPIGSDRPVYRECARQIRRSLERLVAEWVPS